MNTVVSTGVHAHSIESYIRQAPYDQPFTSLLADASILPTRMRNSRLIPAVLYGIHGVRPKIEAAELLGGDIGPSLSMPSKEHFFNPHKQLREEARSLANQTWGKAGSNIRGTVYGLPAYVIDSRSVLYLFVGGADSDLMDLSPKHSEAVAQAYKIGCVVLGGEVVYGDDEHFGIGRTSLPSLIREIGTHIGRLPGGYEVKVGALKYAKRMLEEGKPVEYKR